MNDQTLVGTKLQLRPTSVRLKRRPRIGEIDYVGEYAYHVVLVTHNRRPVFGDGLLVDTKPYADDIETRARRLGFAIHAYCFMPDHLHALAQGVAPTSNLLRFVQHLKQATGYRFKQDTGLQLWQQSFFDRALRRDESIEDVASYVFANPVQAGLVEKAEDYLWSGGLLFMPADTTDGAKASSLRASVHDEST